MIAPNSTSYRFQSLAALIVGGLGATAGAAEEFDGFQDLHGDPGFYPTGEEVDLLGGPSRDMYGRHLGGLTIGGPDAGSLTASGIWHQDPEPTESFYERHDRFFSAIDSVLGPLAPDDVLLWESEGGQRERLYGYTDPGFLLNRDFNPDLASAKLGPLYLDFIKASGKVLYSDYNGTPIPPDDDGWLSILSLDLRGGAQLTQNLFLTLSGSIYYLPSSGEVGFYLGDGRSSYVRLAYEGSIDSWDYVIFNNFRATHRLSEVFDEVEHDEIDVAGRYRFGAFDSTRSNDYFDSDGFVFLNQLGTSFNGPIGDSVHASVSIQRLDFWKSLDFDDHIYWDRIRTRFDYTGFDWPVIPYFEYELSAVDGWDRVYEMFWLGTRARLSENLRVDGRFGYFMSHGSVSDYDRPIGEIGIVHDIGPSTSHSLYGGVRHHNWDAGEDLLAQYVRYSIAQRMGSRLRANMYIQWMDLDNLDGVLRDRVGWSGGARITADVSDYTQCSLGVYYDDWDNTFGPTGDLRRWIYRGTVKQRLLPYLYAQLVCQYEDLESTGLTNYDERLYMLSLDYLF